jgi:predicted peptidase
MKLLISFLAIATSIMAYEPGTQTAEVYNAEVYKTQIREDISLNYLAFVPKGYGQSSKKFPLMLFLHGAGERGTNINAVSVHGPPKIVKTNDNFPFILISPQCAPNQRWERQMIMAFLDEMITKYKPDTNRIYLTGLSMGGYGSWDLAANYPDRFAAVIPICGGGQTIDVKLANAARKKAYSTLGIWAFTGAKDPVVPVEESQRMVEAFKAAGCKDIQLTIYPEANHDSWTETYNNPKIYEWLLEHKR